jgi:hypothetical protein
MLESLSEMSEAIEVQFQVSQIVNLEGVALARATALWQEVVNWYDDLHAPTPTLCPIPSLTTARLKLAECELAKTHRKTS